MVSSTFFMVRNPPFDKMVSLSFMYGSIAASDKQGLVRQKFTKEPAVVFVLKVDGSVF